MEKERPRYAKYDEIRESSRGKRTNLGANEPTRTLFGNVVVTSKEASSTSPIWTSLGSVLLIWTISSRTSCSTESREIGIDRRRHSHSLWSQLALPVRKLSILTVVVLRSRDAPRSFPVRIKRVREAAESAFLVLDPGTSSCLTSVVDRSRADKSYSAQAGRRNRKARRKVRLVLITFDSPR